MKKYSYDVEKNIHINMDGKQLNYSDGGEEERKLMQIASSGIDLSTFSEDLSGTMSSWPTEYHFSKKRHLVVRQFGIKAGDKVLELGAGCGSVTRYLAEIGAEVTSVEGTAARAAVNGKRCKDFPNVKIYVDNITQFETDEKFDWILMIGVLEYSPKYASTQNPPDEYLSIAKKLIKPTGKFVLAIENKLGIKYMNGASEDHNGKIFYGPEDLYNKKDITTWGKSELKNILNTSGFISTEFHSTFPDYKLPTLLINESADQHINFRSEELLHYIKSHDYRGNHKRLYEESFMAASLRKNGILSNFANSFVIVSSLHENSISSNELATYYSIGRKKQYCTKTIFNVENNQIIVTKKLLNESHQNTDFDITLQDNQVITIKHNINPSSQYIHGQMLGYIYSKAQKRSDAVDVTTALNVWVDVLKNEFKFYSRIDQSEIQSDQINGNSISNILIDGKAIDCGMHNIIINAEEAKPFDLEWITDSKVPLVWVLVRNITVAAREDFKIMTKVKLETIVNYVAKQLNVTVNDADIVDAKRMEKIFGLNISKRERSDSLPLVPMLG